MAQQFKKGTDPRRNTKGRPKGKANSSTEAYREMIKHFVDRNFSDVEAQFKSMEPKDKAMFMDKMLRHVLPAPQDELMRLSDEDLDRLIERLKNDRLKIV